MIDAEFLQQSMLSLDHVAIAVLRKARAQAVAGLAGFAVADAVGQDDEIFRRVQHSAGTKQSLGEVGAQKVSAAAARAMHDEHGILRLALRITLQLTDRAVMQSQLGQDFVRLEPEILDDDVAFDRRGKARLREANAL